MVINWSVSKYPYFSTRVIPFHQPGSACNSSVFNDKTQGNQTTAAYFLIGVVFTQFTALIMYRVYYIIKPFITCNLHIICRDVGDDDNNVHWRYNDLEMTTDQCQVSDTACSQDGATPSSYTKFTDGDGTQLT